MTSTGSLCYAGFPLPFLAVSILMTNALSLPGALWVCLTTGLRPGLGILLRVPLSLQLRVSYLMDSSFLI